MYYFSHNNYLDHEDGNKVISITHRIAENSFWSHYAQTQTKRLKYRYIAKI